MGKKIICSDAIGWLRNHDDIGSVVTSLPDAAEIGLSIEDWLDWFIGAASLCVLATKEVCPCVFYQTDRRENGRLISKSNAVFSAADSVGANVLWHKIVLRRDVGAVDLFRPSYTHMIAVSIKGSSGKAMADVIDRGAMLYDNAMGLRAARYAVEYAGRYDTTIVDPFCGVGTVPAMADALGFDGVGVDIDPIQVAHAKSLVLTESRSKSHG